MSTSEKAGLVIAACMVGFVAMALLLAWAARREPTHLMAQDDANYDVAPHNI